MSKLYCLNKLKKSLLIKVVLIDEQVKSTSTKINDNMFYNTCNEVKEIYISKEIVGHVYTNIRFVDPMRFTASEEIKLSGISSRVEGSGGNMLKEHTFESHQHTFKLLEEFFEDVFRVYLDEVVLK